VSSRCRRTFRFESSAWRLSSELRVADGRPGDEKGEEEAAEEEDEEDEVLEPFSATLHAYASKKSALVWYSA